MNVPSHIVRYPTKEAVERLAARFGFPTGPNMQDWEWEVADPSRLDEFQAVYETGDLSEDEKFTLMETILESFEDIARVGADLSSDPRWSRTLAALERNISLHTQSVWYWSCLEADGPEEMFHVSPFIRQILAAHEALFVEPGASPNGGPVGVFRKPIAGRVPPSLS
jgi:hypothetical protein